MAVDRAEGVAVLAVGEGLVQSSHVEMVAAAGVVVFDKGAGHVYLRMARVFLLRLSARR